MYVSLVRIMPATPMPGAPEIIRRPASPESEQSQDEEHREEQQPHFVDRIAAVENETGRNRHRERGDPADISSDEAARISGVSQTQPMLTRTTGRRNAQMFRPNNVSERKRT